MSLMDVIQVAGLLFAGWSVMRLRGKAPPKLRAPR